MLPNVKATTYESAQQSPRGPWCSKDFYCQVETVGLREEETLGPGHRTHLDALSEVFNQS